MLGSILFKDGRVKFERGSEQGTCEGINLRYRCLVSDIAQLGTPMIPTQIVFRL